MNADHSVRPPVPNRTLITLSLTLGMILQTLDSTIATVALPHMQGTLAATQDQIAWVLTSYILATAIMTPPSGFLANRFGRKKVLLLSTGLFVLSSALCGAAASLEQMVLFRFMQGFSGAALSPLTQALLLDLYPGKERGKAMGMFGVGVMIGPILGPTLGGFLTETYDWRWVFYINLPFGLAALAGLILFLPESPLDRVRRFDFTGFSFLSLSIGALQLAVDRGNSLDWFNSTEIIVELALSALCLYLFMVHIFTARNPFIEPGLFRDRNFAAGLLFNFLASSVMMATLALLPIFLQNLLGIPVLTAGYLMAPRGIGTLLAMVTASILIGRFDPRLLILTGIVLTVTGMWEMAGFTLDVSNAAIVRTGLIQGLGLGLIMIPVSTLSFSTLAPHFRNEGTAMYALIRNLGGSLCISLVMTQIQRKTQFNHATLVEAVTPFQDALPPQWDWSTSAGAMALNQEVTRQAASLAYFDTFALMAGCVVLVAPLLLLFRRVDLSIDAGARVRTPVAE